MYIDKYTAYPYSFQIPYCEFTYFIKFICNPKIQTPVFMNICRHVISGGKFEYPNTHICS